MKGNKWGFGIAPISDTTHYKNTAAIAQTLRYINRESVTGTQNIEEYLSHLKGLFNRIIRQDQWDWFTVNMYFDYPNINEVILYVNSITQLRKGILER